MTYHMLKLCPHCDGSGESCRHADSYCTYCDGLGVERDWISSREIKADLDYKRWKREREGGD